MGRHPKPKKFTIIYTKVVNGNPEIFMREFDAMSADEALLDLTNRFGKTCSHLIFDVGIRYFEDNMVEEHD